MPAGNHLWNHLSRRLSKLQNREIVFELRNPLRDGMLGAAAAFAPLLRGLFGAPTHAEMIALAPLDLRSEVLVLGRQIKLECIR